MSSTRSTFLRFTGAALVTGLLSVAACSADGGNAGIPEPDAGPSTTVPESGTPATDGGPDAAPDAPVTTAKCGNFKVEPGEECDDGNTAPGDGCNSSCKLESAFEGDTCPGKAVTLQSSGALLKATVTGSTKGALSHYGSNCGGGSAKDVVYTFTPTSSGKAVVTLTADYPAIVSARSSCADATSESQCADIAAPIGGNTTMEVPVFQNTPVFLFVDGYGGSSGTFTLDIEISQAVCGNGIAELPETCDDGNTTNGDGCSSTCTFETGGVLGQCPGQPFELSGPPNATRKIGFAGNTATQGGDTQTATGCYFWGGNNAIYAVKSDIDGSAKAALLTSYAQAALHARSDCASTTYQIGCSSALAPGTLDVSFPVRAGEWFYLIVDADGDGGPYSLQLEVSPSECGNQVLDGNEECDDGNAVAGDGCAADCTLEPLAGVDTCPGHPVDLTAHPDGSRSAVVSGNTRTLAHDVKGCHANLSSNKRDAVFAVTPDIDGVLELRVNGPFNSTVSVLDTCTGTSGNIGERSAVLACSFGAFSTATLGPEQWVLDGLGSGPKTARAPVVANHTYYVVVDGDGSSDASSSGPFKLDLKVTPGVCGNGILEGTEACDDGGTADDDGCSATCTLEPVGIRDTCDSAEQVQLEAKPGNVWEASLARGNTNLTKTHNFGSTISSAEACWAFGRDAFFKVTAPAGGVLTATARSSAFDVVLGMQKDTCSVKSVEDSCANAGPKGTDESFRLAVNPGDVFYFIVDSSMPNVGGCDKNPYSETYAADCAKLEEHGRFTFDVSIAPSVCGDGYFVPSPDEECDDGNTTSGDGCSATCKLEPVGNVDVCPGVPLTLTGAGTQPRKGNITFSTATLGADYAGACGGGSREGVVKVVAPISGMLRAKVHSMPNSTVHARTTCNDASTEISKSKYSTCIDVVHDTIMFQVTAGSEYYLFVDGLDDAVGVPSLEVTIDP